MGAKRNRRFCRALCIVAVVLDVIAWLGIIGSALCIAHGRMAAIVVLALCIVTVFVANSLYDAAEERM